MQQGITTSETADTGLFAGDAWFDPIEAGIRERIRGFIEELLAQELTALLECGGGGPFLRRGMPVVCFNRATLLPRVDRVATDHAGAMRKGVGLLHAAGHRCLLRVGGAEGLAGQRGADLGLSGAAGGTGRAQRSGRRGEAVLCRRTRGVPGACVVNGGA